MDHDEQLLNDEVKLPWEDAKRGLGFEPSTLGFIHFWAAAMSPAKKPFLSQDKCLFNRVNVFQLSQCEDTEQFLKLQHPMINRFESAGFEPRTTQSLAYIPNRTTTTMLCSYKRA